MSNHNLLLISVIFLISFPAHAYIGPGMAGGVIAVILGFIAAIFLTFFGILYYPIKRAIQNRKKHNNKD